MFKNNSSNSLIIDDFKIDRKEEYMNIAEQDKENVKNKKFEKFKTRNSTRSVTNLLTGEENKLKKMLFSILKHEKTKANKIKSPNRNKKKLFKTNIISSFKEENQIKKLLKKKNKKVKKNLKTILPQKLKKRKLEIELLDTNSPLKNKNIYSRLFVTSKKDTKRNSIEYSELQKKLQNMNSSISKSKNSRNSINSFNKKEKSYCSDDDQTSSKCLNFSKNTTEKMSEKSPIFHNKKRGKNYMDFNKSEEEKLKNICTFNSKSDEEETKNYMRSFSLKNKKSFMVDSFNVSWRKKNRNSVTNSTKIFNNIKNTIIFNFPKSDKNINKLKINNMKIFKKNKEKIRKSLKILPDNHYENSCISNRKNRPKIFESLISSPKRLSCPKVSVKEIEKTLSKNYKNEEIKEKETNINKSAKIMIIINEKFRKLIHKRLIYDSLDDDESELDEIEFNNFYIDPNSKFCFIFDLIIFYLTVHTSISIPYFLAKNLRICKRVYFSFFHLFYFISEIFNIIDTISGFFRAYYTYDEQLIKKSRLMIIKYIKSWFLIDLVSSIPFYTIFNSFESQYNCDNFNKNYNVVIHKLYYLFLCTKMIKLWKVFKNNRSYKKICRILNNYFLFKENGALIAKIYLILLIIHFGACIYIFIGRNSYPNWILNVKMETSGFSEIYITAIYCLIMTITSVGYGDITCYSFNERIYQIILLIFGILAYSWIVSSISNYIEKHNSDLDVFQQKIDILKDIKLNHPNMTNKLYNKIVQHLKYRNLYEKQNKNIIFECLPLSLKNNLIYEMYKPIITKFTFFKNIDNIDFIIKVILAFRPVIAVKNDIIINDGDIVEEIIFVKKGVLIVQLLVNMNDYKENIKKYSTINLFNLQNKSNLEKILNSSDKTSNNSNITKKLTKKNSFDNNSLKSSFKCKIEKKISNEDKNRKYIKIINIRENEHFGDVLMFSEQRSPMRLMVRSNKAEFFILKKEDVVKISFSYSNIWRRINKISVYNFEQMKKSIHKIIKLLSPQTLDKTFLDFDQNNNEEKNSKNMNVNESNNTMVSSSNLDSAENVFIEKEKKIKNKNIRKKKSKKQENKTENSLISSSQYSNISNDKKFHSESNKKLKNKLEMFKNEKVENQHNQNNEKRGYSSKSIANKKYYYLYLNTNPIINNNRHNRNEQSSTTTLTPYRKEEVNQEIYNHEKFELTNVDENSDNLLYKGKFSDNLIISKNNINDINSKSEIKINYIVVKLDNINIISNINSINNKNNNSISKADYFSIGASYENFNSLSKNILINDGNLQKKMKIYLRNQIINPKLSQSIIKNLNLEFTKINDENLINNNKTIGISINKKYSAKALNSISFDSKNRNNNNFSVNGIRCSKFNNSKKDINDSILNSFNEGSNKIIPTKTNSNLSFNRVCIDRNLSVNSSFQLFSKHGYSGNKINKNIGNLRSRSNSNLLSLINGNILNSKKNLIEPDKFYRRYFNELINTNTRNNNQSNYKKKKYNSRKSRINLLNLTEDYKNLSTKIKTKRYKTCTNKKNK